MKECQIALTVDTIISKSPEETMLAGKAFAARLRSGDVVALCGDLGAGKTQFTKGLVSAFGGDPSEVSSPTFTLINEYRDGSLPVFHFDLYRLEDNRELPQMGWLDYLEEAEGVLVVEWADKFREALPKGTIFVRFEICDGNERLLRIES